MNESNRATMKAALKFIETLKVPKNLNEAGTQIWQGSFVIDRLRAALAQPVAEIEADMSERLYTAKQMSQYGQDCFEEGLASCPPAVSAIAQEPLSDQKIWDIAADYFDADAQYDGVIAFARAVLTAPATEPSLGKEPEPVSFLDGVVAHPSYQAKCDRICEEVDEEMRRDAFGERP